MKTSIIAFVFSALIGIGFHHAANAAPKKQEKPKVEAPKVEAPKEEAPKDEPGQGGSAQCEQLAKDYQAAEEAADSACEKDEGAACQAAEQKISDLEKQLGDAKCEGAGAGDDDGDDDGQ